MSCIQPLLNHRGNCQWCHSSGSTNSANYLTTSTAILSEVLGFTKHGSCLSNYHFFGEFASLIDSDADVLLLGWINHPLMIRKLDPTGVAAMARNWLQVHLNDRVLCAQIEDTTSHPTRGCDSVSKVCLVGPPFLPWYSIPRYFGRHQ